MGAIASKVSCITMPKFFVAMTALLLLLLPYSTDAAARSSTPALSILHSFGSAGNSGVDPVASLIQGADGSIYGTTANGGSAGGGTVFSMTSSFVVTTLHSFGDGSVANDGTDPAAGLVQGTDRNFYGTTAVGGSAGGGTVFRMTPSGTVSILHSFGDGSVANDGTNPAASLIQDKDGSFYGTTAKGGSAGDGTVFQMTSSGAVTILHSFNDGSVANDGTNPAAALIQGTDGNFYGTTDDGGSAGDGTVFQITASGGVTILHSFNDGSVANDGTNPAAGLIQGTDGNFYGTTENGGSAGVGTVFNMTPSFVVTTLHSFGDGTTLSDGSNPRAPLVQGSDGNLSGTTSNGGSSPAPGAGTVFRMAVSGVVTILHSFGNVQNDGRVPDAGLIQGSDGSFYGTTYGGGSSSGGGSVFEMSPSGSVAIVHSFGATDDGNFPEAPPIQGKDGSFYGTTDLGGSEGAGTVFRMTSAGVVTILHSFGDGTVANDGWNPSAGLIQASDGNFYGTTTELGQGLFRMTELGVVTTVHSFGDGTVANDGNDCEAVLIQGSDGSLYGTTNLGGSANDGTLFSMTLSGTVIILHSFGDGSVVNDGTNPLAGLIQGKDGSFYGTTQQGGSAGQGTIFQMTSSGAVTILHSFGDGSVVNDGNAPQASLIQGSDGSFYGTTPQGGSAGDGTVFKMTSSGSVTILHSFDDGSVTNDGIRPDAGLVQGTDGNLYGTTSTGGSAGNGTAFKMTPAGSVTILHSFDDGSIAHDGFDPEAGLIQGTDGNFYGTTTQGGSGNDGTVFRLSGAPQLTASVALASSQNPAALGQLITFAVTVTAAAPASGTPTGTITFLDGTAALGARTLANGQAAFSTPILTSGTHTITAHYSGDTMFAPGQVALTQIVWKAWLPADIAVGADNRCRVLWSNPDGRAVLWSLDRTSGNYTQGPVFGPFDGGAWHAARIACGSDGISHVLWNKADGTLSLWWLNANNTFQTNMVYGPFASWVATDIAVGSDNLTRILWTNVNDGRAVVWSVNASGVASNNTNFYGPYTGYTAVALACGSDGLSRLIWANPLGIASLWIMNVQNQYQSSTIFGPYTGWIPTDIDVGSDDLARVLWTNTVDGRAIVWSVNATGTPTNNQNFDGPFNGYTAQHVACGTDGFTRLTWLRGDGTLSFWHMSSENIMLTFNIYGPYL